MNNEKIEGIGSIHGGEYEKISVEGMGKLKSDATVKHISVEGMFKSKGKIVADEMNVEGMARIHRDLKIKSLHIDGLMKVRRASISAGKIVCDGLLICNREVLADEIQVDGMCSISKMYGDHIVIENNISKLSDTKIPTNFMFLVKGYFGRKISLTHSLVDIVECTELEASGLKAAVIKANKVKLEGNCIVNKLYCDGEMIIDDSCHVNEIISKNKPINMKKEIGGMADVMLTKILDLYKEGKINADEAEKMLGASGKMPSQSSNSSVSTPWEDDGKLRVVAFIGKKLLKKGEAGAKSLEIKIEGEVKNVECYGSLQCGTISGSASAGGSIHSNDIGGNASCGGSLTCASISGNVSAGGGVHINR
ncbi:MAG: hypothetical protein K0S47_3067 [Herbinix sp.]|jgi:cytoskeletal protein CcmA (bactofilin family)|nr:hypothetical protein [Herbinix sp.]